MSSHRIVHGAALLYAHYATRTQRTQRAAETPHYRDAQHNRTRNHGNTQTQLFAAPKGTVHASIARRTWIHRGKLGSNIDSSSPLAVSAPHGCCGQRTRFAARCRSGARAIALRWDRYRAPRRTRESTLRFSTVAFPRARHTLPLLHSLSPAAPHEALAEILVVAPRIAPAIHRGVPLPLTLSRAPRCEEISPPWVSCGKA